jgi:hypothetical protein
MTHSSDVKQQIRDWLLTQINDDPTIIDRMSEADLDRALAAFGVDSSVLVLSEQPLKPMEGKCDRIVRLVNESGEYPDHRAFRASDAGSVFLVLIRDKLGAISQIEWPAHKDVDTNRTSD